MVEIPDWARAVAQAIASDDPLAAAEHLPFAHQHLDDLSLRLYFGEVPPPGILAREMASVDRAFRYGARFVETRWSAAEFRARPRPPILPLVDGLVLSELGFGSLDLGFVPSPRIRKALVRGAVVIGTAVTYLNSGFGVRDHVTTAHDRPHQPIYLAPRQLQLGMTRGQQLVQLTLQSPDGRVYTLSELSSAHVTPHPQLAGATP